MPKQIRDPGNLQPGPAEPHVVHAPTVMTAHYCGASRGSGSTLDTAKTPYPHLILGPLGEDDFLYSTRS